MRLATAAGTHIRGRPARAGLAADALPSNDELAEPIPTALNDRAAAAEVAAKLTPTVEPPVTIAVDIDSHSAGSNPNPLRRCGS